MTYKPNTCHWCGAEANSSSKIACKIHLPLSKKKNKEIYKERSIFAREHGLCATCYKRPKRKDMSTCKQCGEKHIRHERIRRELASQRKYDEIIDKEYITVDKAAFIMNVHRSTILRLIHKNILVVRCLYNKGFYISEADVYELKKHYIR